MALGRYPARVLQTQWLLCAAAGTLQIVLGISASHSARPGEGKEGRPPRLLGSPSPIGAYQEDTTNALGQFGGIFLSLRNRYPSSAQLLLPFFFISLCKSDFFLPSFHGEENSS